MIDVFEALSWLNAIDNRSCLDDETRRLIGYATRFTPRDSKVTRILERLRSAAHSWGDAAERGEILLHCAALGYWRGCFVEAARDVGEAILLYDEDEHRRAVALWIQGMAQWQMCENHLAYVNWADARDLFNKRKIFFQNFPQEKARYKSWVRRMNADLVARPEEIWTWLNWFEPSCLRPPTQPIVACMQQKTRQGAYSNIYALMQDLQEATRVSQALYERAEIYLEFGLAIYQMGNTHFAIELLRKSVLNFFPGMGPYHKQTVARAMLGAVEWLHELCRDQADADWDRSYEDFEKLRTCASKDNDETKRDWYTERSASLYEALQERRRGNPKPPPANGCSPENGPARYSAPPGGRTYTYDDLLIKLRRDRAMADRLIEFERKKVPNANRNEWIRRAIERWERDNQ